MLVVKGSNKFQGTFIDRLDLSQEEGAGELRISSVRQGPSRDFWGLKCSISGLCGVEKIFKARAKELSANYSQKSKTTLFKNNKKLYLILQPRGGNTYTDCLKNASKIKFKSTERERICLASHLFTRLFKKVCLNLVFKPASRRRKPYFAWQIIQ